MFEFINKLFDLKKFPAKLIIVVWLTAGIALFAPPNFLHRLNVVDFIKEYGKYLGIAFLLCSAILIVIIISYVSSRVSRRVRINKRKFEILRTLKSLDPHERALLREFFIQGKSALQLPMDNDTVEGLSHKGIIYKVSNVGFTYIHGPTWSYAITEYARENLMHEDIDLPENPTEEQKRQVLQDRPQWAKTKSRLDDLLN